MVFKKQKRRILDLLGLKLDARFLDDRDIKSQKFLFISIIRFVILITAKNSKQVLLGSIALSFILHIYQVNYKMSN